MAVGTLIAPPANAEEQRAEPRRAVAESPVAVKDRLSDVVTGPNAAAPGVSSKTYPEILNVTRSALRNRLIQAEPLAADGIAEMRHLLAYRYSGEFATDLQHRFNEERMNSLERDVGLNAVGGYTRPAGGSVFDPDTEGEIGTRAFVGIEWDLLRDGLRDSRRNRSLLEKQNTAETLRAPLARKEENLPFLYYYTIYVFNYAKLEKLRERISVLDQYLNAVGKLYHFRYTAWEEVIRARAERLVAENMLKNLHDYNSSIAVRLHDPGAPVDAMLLPLVDVSLDGVIESHDRDGAYLRLSELERDRLEDKYGLLNDIRLRAFLRRNYEKDGTPGRDEYTTAGLYVRVPIPLRSGYASDLRRTEEDLLVHGVRAKRENAISQIQDTYYEYQYKLNDAIKFYHKLLLLRERLRKEYLKQVLGDPEFSPVNALKLVDELLATEFEFLDIKQQLYLKLVELDRHMEGEGLLWQLSAVNLNARAGKYPLRMTTYGWSAAFNKLDNEFLLWFLRTNEVDELLVSVGKKTNPDKLGQFLDGAAARGLRVHALIGENDLLRTDKRAALEKLVRGLANQKFAGLHVDIEPHVLPDWRGKRAYYLDRYIEMIEFIRALVGENYPLSVSIPTFYPVDALTRIYRVADRVFVMAYETAQPETILGRVEEELAVSREKTVIALRPKDFRNWMHLVESMEGLSKGAGIGRVALHDLQGMLSLEARSVSVLEPGGIAP